MIRTVTLCVTVGCDGSRASRAAAEWAAREARMLGLPVHLLHVREPDHPSRTAWSGDTADALVARHPGLDVRAEQLPADKAAVIERALELHR